MGHPASLRVNPERLAQDFQALGHIGATADGLGVHRPALSPAHLEARRWLAGRVQQAGLELRIDPAGNISGFLACGPAGAPTLLLGSHLDSVPNGGRYDGALGVLAALEVLRVVHESGLELPCHLEAIDFTDEEGTLVGLLGSSALAGTLKPEELLAPRGGRPALEEGLARAGLTEAGLWQARRNPSSLAGYLELHVEQGPRLVNAGIPIGIVTAIVGICSYRLDFTGRADHAGTTPMPDRRDAGLGASAFSLAVRRLIMEEFPDCVANIGQVAYTPGAFNIVPERASLALELRASDGETFSLLEAALLDQAQQVAETYSLGLETHFLGRHPPTPMSTVARQAISVAAAGLGLACQPLVSGAGHDAQSLAPLCPAGMIFIPSQGGASHSPREYSHWEDCLNGANVLMHAALRWLS
jgi:beta-ureidopropionase / N-carbamoyl-L-amino-acid hydrolase